MTSSETGERIQKVLSRAGIASRREAERWIAEGRVTVNGAVVTTPGTKVDVSRDHLKVDGRRVRPSGPRVYYVLNKPDNYVTTTKDPEGRAVVMDLMGPLRGKVFPVGRLDYHTTGVLILTNDGELADRLLRPATGCEKVYQAKVKGVPDAATLRRLAQGVTIDGQRTLPCRMRLLESEKHSWVEVRLKEGRRNQIRKMFETVGHPVSKLRRVAVGPISDRGLALGRYRALTESEIRRLKETVE